MKSNNIVKEIYTMLEKKQMLGFLWIILILIVTAGLSQLTPVILGILTDHVLEQNNLSFFTVFPYLAFYGFCTGNCFRNCCYFCYIYTTPLCHRYNLYSCNSYWSSYCLPSNHHPKRDSGRIKRDKGEYGRYYRGITWWYRDHKSVGQCCNRK